MQMTLTRFTAEDITITMAGIFSFFNFLGYLSAKGKGNRVTVSGALEINCHAERKTSLSWLINGGSRNRKMSTAYFEVKHNGKNIALPGGSNHVNYFWQALFLKDAPKPAVLAASQSMYMITDENGAAEVTQLSRPGDNFSTYQWLDSDNNQPSAKKEVYVNDESKSERFISGGSYLLIGTQAILDVQTLAIYHIDTNTAQRITQLGGYHLFDSRAVGFSPAKTQIVFVGYRRNTKNQISEYALIAIDFLQNTAYAVPFDRTDTHFFSIWDATHEWVSTYFSWTSDAAGKEVLVLKG